MKKIKVNSDIYVGEDKLATVKEVNEKIVNNGTGNKFLADDGTYKEVPNDHVYELTLDDDGVNKIIKLSVDGVVKTTLDVSSLV